MQTKRSYLILLWSFLCLLPSLLPAQVTSSTTISGILYDRQTGEPIPYATISTETRQSVTGTASDDKGAFTIKLQQELIASDTIALQISCIGYEGRTLRLDKYQNHELGRIPLSRKETVIETVVVKPKKERYRRKGNPAVTIMRQVMQHKERNHLSALPDYSYQLYQKTLLAQGDVTRGKGYWGIPKWRMKSFVDSSALARTPILPFSLRERHIVYAQQSGHPEPPLLLGTRHKGVEQVVDEGLLSSNIDALLAPVDIYNNDLSLLSKEIIGPLHAQLGITFYKYYLRDTIPDASGNPCYQIQFVPIEMRDAGFSGTLLVDTVDYSIHRVEMRLPTTANVNWVDRLEITIDYAPQSITRQDGRPDTLWLPERQRLDALFRVSKRLDISALARVTSIYSHYETGTTALRPETLDPRLLLPADTLQQLMTRVIDDYGLVVRPEPIDSTEQRATQLVDYILHDPGYKLFSLGARMASVGFIPIPAEPLHRERVYLDLGPLETLISANLIEGVRLRLGGMTTARLHNQLFAEGYVTYGFKDKKWKYYARLIYATKPKELHPHSYPRNNFALAVRNDLFFPGEESYGLYKDGIASIFGTYGITRRYYGLDINASHEIDWSPSLYSNIWVDYQRQRPTGTLHYYALDAEGNQYEVEELRQAEIGASLSWTPGRTPYSGRKPGSIVSADIYKPTFTLSGSIYPRGLWGNEQTHGALHLAYSQRLYLSIFGALDITLQSGIALGDTPQSQLFTPYGNRAWLLVPDAFQTIQPLEFIADKYLDFKLLYRMEGLLFNRIPLVKRLGLRELVGIHGYWGDTSPRHRSPRPGQILLPTYAEPMRNNLHLEFSAGLSNIFKMLSVQYFYRITGKGLPARQRHSVRLGISVSF